MSEKIPQKESLELQNFREEVQGLVNLEVANKEAGEEYLDDLSRVNSGELTEEDRQMYDLIKQSENMNDEEADILTKKFHTYRQQVKKANLVSRWNFVTYLADRLMEKLK